MFRNDPAQNTENRRRILRKQLLDIIEWEDDSQDTLVMKFPMQDNEIQNGGMLGTKKAKLEYLWTKALLQMFLVRNP